MKRIIIVSAAVLIVLVTGFIACNSSTSPSKSKEGVMEITGPADKENVSADTAKQFTPM